MDKIRVEGLTKFYGKTKGIENVNLVVEEGDFYGFIGPNGDGKSTTIRSLLGYIKPTSGTGYISGKDITKFSREIRADVGYLPSETTFYKGMRVSDIIKLSADLRKKDCSTEAKILCDRLSLDTGKKTEQLSFGNRKKLGIVCALQHRPGLYILDEPTSGLDPLIQKEFFDILEERNKEGATIFFSSHVLSEIQKHCHKAAIIGQGQIIASGEVESLAKTNAKRIILHGADRLPVLEGMKDVAQAGGDISFLYRGDIKKLLEELVKYDFNDLSIAEPDLEEIFIHYYEKGGQEK